jgi:hypothetical protein
LPRRRPPPGKRDVRALVAAGLSFALTALALAAHAGLIVA